MKILITGIGCIGKSSLRKRLYSDFPNRVISADMDYDKQIPSDAGKVIIVESIHGLENNPEIFDKILYLLPPKWHIILWLRRAWIWFATGIVNLSAPKGKRKRFSIYNIPIILKILMRNIFGSKKWIRKDLSQIQKGLEAKTNITPSVREGYKIIKSWIGDYIDTRKE